MDGIRKAALFLYGMERKTSDLLLRRLDPETVASVRREMASLGDVSPQAMKRIAHDFLFAVGQRDGRMPGIKRGTDDFSVRQSRPAKVTSRRFGFDDLSRLDNSDLSTLFHAVDATTAMLSLVGAEPLLIERVTKRFSPAEERRMREHFKQHGPFDQYDVDRARIAILEKAELLLSRHGEVV